MHGWGAGESLHVLLGRGRTASLLSEQWVREGSRKRERGREGGRTREKITGLETEGGKKSVLFVSFPAVHVSVVRMSSPCLCRAVPVSQTRLREVKLSLKTSRETIAIRSTPVVREVSSRQYTSVKDVPTRTNAPGSRSRSTPPVYRAQSKRGAKNNSPHIREPEHLPQRNGTLLGITPKLAPMTLTSVSSTSSSSSSCTPRGHRPSPQRSSPSCPLSPSRGMRRARWLSYSASNICFNNSILDGRFRQLQGSFFLPLSKRGQSFLAYPPPCHWGFMGLGRDPEWGLRWYNTIVFYWPQNWRIGLFFYVQYLLISLFMLYIYMPQLLTLFPLNF